MEVLLAIQGDLKTENVYQEGTEKGFECSSQNAAVISKSQLFNYKFQNL